MTSAFGWLDTDEEQRKRMLELVELFKDEDTVDEIGIGSIRDTIADILFPGTSVLHTRLRYVLLVPWLLDQTCRRRLRPEQATTEMRRLEIRLIYALLNGGETDGVIGHQAREKLKRMPSAAYWSMTRRWGVRTWDTTIQGFFHKANNVADLRQLEPEADGSGAHGDRRLTGLHPDTPLPPADLLQTCDFDLTVDEAGFLTDRIAEATKGSLLAWFVQRARSTDILWVWDHPAVHEFPTELAEVVDHARRFHSAMHGAALLYNLLLAERAQRDELADDYREKLDDWSAEIEDGAVLDGWNRHAFWTVVIGRNPRLAPSTRAFVDRWLDGISKTARVQDSQTLREHVARRERRIKGARARLVNQAALDRWSGHSGLVRLDYRWGVTSRLLADLYTGQEAV